jgi:hypothetical protein
MDPRLHARYQLIFQELTEIEKWLRAIHNKLPYAQIEVDELIKTVLLSDKDLYLPKKDDKDDVNHWAAYTKKAGWSRGGPNVALRAIVPYGYTLASRWEDYLVLSDQKVPDRDDTEIRRYSGPIEDLNKSPLRPGTSAPEYRFPRSG